MEIYILYVGKGLPPRGPLMGFPPGGVIDEKNAMAVSGNNNKRVINYLRLSVTDRCNLRCMYCMPDGGVDFVPHGSILTYEEILHLVKLSVLHGIRKVRLTGGEPLVRKGFIPFLERLCSLEGLAEITLTTNGVLLKEYAEDIKKCGICRVNISLDSLKPENFFRITGRNYYEKVWEGIQEAERVGFNPIKINVVAIRGLNDDEILDFARLTFEKPYHIRFIEFMPVGERNAWSYQRFIPADEILDKIRTLGKLQSVEKNSTDGPAERYRLEGAQGELGLISALSNHFCHKCNRLRLTAEGHLRGCLFSDQEIDLKTPLREGRPDAYLMELLKMAVENKPEGHGLIKSAPRKCIRQMSSIGG
jgi:cyclic pyranopterin phosphate synthase